MGYYSVEDFNLPYPAWSRPLRRIRQGAMTAFVDKASGELVAGYSYTTCLYAVVESAEYPKGQLFQNLTTYSVTTSGKHSWPLYCKIAKYLRGDTTYGWEAGTMVETKVTPPSAPICNAIGVPQGTTAAELVVRCRMQLPVDVAVAARKVWVDTINASMADGDAPNTYAAFQARDAVVRPFRDALAEACDTARRAERRNSREVYGDEHWKRREREARAEARREREAEAASAQPVPAVNAHIDRMVAALGGDADTRVVHMVRREAAPGELPPGCFMLDGKVYGTPTR